MFWTGFCLYIYINTSIHFVSSCFSDVFLLFSHHKSDLQWFLCKGGGATDDSTSIGDDERGGVIDEDVSIGDNEGSGVDVIASDDDRNGNADCDVGNGNGNADDDVDDAGDWPEKV
ncbi:unnamed protein product [Absidia cylindrospora]